MEINEEVENVRGGQGLEVGGTSRQGSEKLLWGDEGEVTGLLDQVK